MDNVRRHKSNRLIGAITIFLMGLGLIIIYAIGPMRANALNAAYGTEVGENDLFIHQLICVVLSLIIFFVGFKLPYQLVRKSSKVLLIISFTLCFILAGLALIHSPLASCQLGACRWFNIPLIGGFQPAELLKFSLVLYLAQLIATRKQEGNLDSLKEFWLPFIIVSGLALLIVVIVQKDLGTGVAIIAIILSTLFMSGISMKRFFLVLGIIAIGGVLAIVTSSHRMERIMTFSSDESSDNYHIENAMIAIGTGGFFGVGIGNSIQATGYLPESINDSIFAVLGETFGFLGLILIVGCFTLLLYNLLKTSTSLPTEESLVVVGIFAWVAAHVFLNIAAMTNLIPLTGITLPLLSYGGTSMFFISAALGLASQLSCYTGREVKNENISSRRRVGGTYNTGRRRSA